VKLGWGRIVRLAISIAVLVMLVMFARNVNWAQAWESMRSASLPLLLLAMLVNIATVGVKGVRWWLFLAPAGLPSLPVALRATVAGAGLNNILVANGGEAARVLFVSRKGKVSSAIVLATLALERVFDPVGFVMLLVAAALFTDLPPAVERWALPAEIALVALIGLLAYFVYSARHVDEVDLLKASTEHGPAGGWARVKAYFFRFLSSTRALASGPRFAWALLLSMIAWIGQLAVFAISAEAAHVSIPLAGSLAALLATNLGLLLRATPGNVGFFQVMYALTAAEFGVGKSEAIAVSLLIQTLQVIPMTLLAIALAPEFILRRKTS
jgi:glycosyltransferase 2 family protein